MMIAPTGELIAFATSLSTRYSLQPMWSLDEGLEFPFLRVAPLPHLEIEACAVIVLTLKYLFGFDGHEEYAASIAAEQRNASGNVKHFVVSHWLTQLSRRAHFLRRRGEFFNSFTLDFEHISSSAHLVRHDAKRRSDFYARGANFRRCQQFLDDLRIPNKITAPMLTPTSFPMRGTIEQLLSHECREDSLGLLDDMTNFKVVEGHEGSRPYHLASTRQSRFYRDPLKQTPSGDPIDASILSPSANLLTIVQLLGEYCLSSGIMLHWALMRVESKVFNSTLTQKSSSKRRRSSNRNR